MEYIKKIFTRQAITMAFLVMAVVFLFGYSSYALFMRIDRYNINQAMSIGDLGVSFSVASASGIPNHVYIESAKPMNDNDATNSNYDGNKFLFAVTNYGKEKSDYMVYLTNMDSDTSSKSSINLNLSDLLNHEYIKVQIDDGKIYKLSELEKGLIVSGEVIFGEANVIYHSLRVWIDENYTGNINTINLKLDFESIHQTENIKKLSLSKNIKELSKNNLKLNENTNSYFFTGKVDNNNLVYGKDHEGNDLNWKIIEVSDTYIKLVLNNTTMITSLKAKYEEIDTKLNEWYSLFTEDTKSKVLLSVNGKRYTTLTKSDIENSTLSSDAGNEYALSMKVSAWLQGESILKFDTNGIVVASSNESNYVFPVVTINGSLKYISGNGTEVSPYKFETK